MLLHQWGFLVISVLSGSPWSPNRYGVSGMRLLGSFQLAALFAGRRYLLGFSYLLRGGMGWVGIWFEGNGNSGEISDGVGVLFVVC